MNCAVGSGHGWALPPASFPLSLLNTWNRIPGTPPHHHQFWLHMPAFQCSSSRHPAGAAPDFQTWPQYPSASPGPPAAAGAALPAFCLPPFCCSGANPAGTPRFQFGEPGARRFASSAPIPFAPHLCAVQCPRMVGKVRKCVSTAFHECMHPICPIPVTDMTCLRPPWPISRLAPPGCLAGSSICVATLRCVNRQHAF